MSIEDKDFKMPGIEQVKVSDDGDKLENKEQQERAFFSLKIDKEMLGREIESLEDENGKELLEQFLRLPDNLKFEPGKTIIIGYNGSGKSTLAKALFLAAKVEKKLEWSREVDSLMGFNKDLSDQEKRDNARESVFNPNEGEKAWMLSSGYAPVLAKCLTTEEFKSESAVVEYADFQTVGGIVKSSYNNLPVEFDLSGNFAAGHNAREYHEASKVFRSEQKESQYKRVAETSKRMGSARQTVDQLSKKLVYGDYEELGSVVVFLDEPETGMDPFRKMKIGEELDTIIGLEDNHKGSIAIIPTNETELYKSDLPRIDLRFPERGIFRPSEYADYFEKK